EAFRNDFLYIWPRTLAAEWLNVNGNIASVFGGLPGALVGGVFKGIGDNVTSDIGRVVPGVQARLNSQAEGMDAVADVIGKLQLMKDLLNAGSVAYHEKIERNEYNRRTFVGRDSNINTKYPSDYLGENSLLPPLGQSNPDVSAIISIRPYSEYRLDGRQAL